MSTGSTESTETRKKLEEITDYFEELYSVQEYELEGHNKYADGTLFPVHIGDAFPPPEEGVANPTYRYRIMTKIGHGSYSTVWLALDLETRDHVALKFLCKGNDQELLLFRCLEDKAGSHPGQEHIVALRDSFRVGRENEYVVLVLDLLIPWNSLDPQHIEELDLQSMALQVCCGLSYLHGKNITHGDLHQGNIALKVSPEFLFDGDDFILELTTPEVIPILPQPYDAQERARHWFPKYPLPKYMMDSNVFRHYVRKVLKKDGVLASAKIQIIDLSNGYQDIPNVVPETKRTIKAPEFFVYELTDEKSSVGGLHSDIWALAITMFNMVSGPREQLYNPSQYSYDDRTLLNIVTKVATEVPAAWSEALERKKNNLQRGEFGERGLPYCLTHRTNAGKKDPRLKTAPQEIVIEIIEKLQSDLEGCQGDEKGGEPWTEGASLLEESVRKEFLGLVKDMLQLDPADRPTCEEVYLRLSKFPSTDTRIKASPATITHVPIRLSGSPKGRTVSNEF